MVLDKIRLRIHDLKRYQVHYIWTILVISLLAFLILLFIFNAGFEFEKDLVFLQPFPGAVNLSSCGLVNSTGTYFVLNGALNNLGSCLHVVSNNVVIDGLNLYRITGAGTPGSIGILVDANNVTIKNLNISNFASNIAFRGANNSIVENNNRSTKYYVFVRCDG